jgi:hypothetical protein
MNTHVSISNIIRIDHINQPNKARLVYKNEQNQTKEIVLKSAEREWLKKHPNRGLLNKLQYKSNGIRYICDRHRSPENPTCRKLIFFMPKETCIIFFCDDTNEVRFIQMLNLLHSHQWGTFDNN